MLNSIKIEQLIPHRNPMIMVDSLVSFDESSSVCTLNIKEDNIFIDGPYLSESGILEHMAQVAAVHNGHKYFKEKTPRNGYVAAIQKAEFFQSPKIAKTITTELKSIYETKEILKVELTSFVDKVPVANAILITILKPKGDD